MPARRERRRLLMYEPFYDSYFWRLSRFVSLERMVPTSSALKLHPLAAFFVYLPADMKAEVFIGLKICLIPKCLRILSICDLMCVLETFDSWFTLLLKLLRIKMDGEFKY